MTKPRGYRQAAAEQLFWLLVLCLPYCQSLLLAGMSGMLSVPLMTCVLIFMAARSGDIGRTIVALVRAIPLGWVTPLLYRRRLWVSVPLQARIQRPSLAPSFQRPPPIFS